MTKPIDYIFMPDKSKVFVGDFAQYKGVAVKILSLSADLKKRPQIIEGEVMYQGEVTPVKGSELKSM